MRRKQKKKEVIKDDRQVIEFVNTRDEHWGLEIVIRGTKVITRRISVPVTERHEEGFIIITMVPGTKPGGGRENIRFIQDLGIMTFEKMWERMRKRKTDD